MKRLSTTNWVNIFLIVISFISELNYTGGTCGPYLGDFLLLGAVLFSSMLFLASLILRLSNKDSWLSVVLNLLALGGMVAYLFYWR